MNPHQVTKDFERALCEYTGAPYCVAVNSCTMALLLAAAWHLQKIGRTPEATCQEWDDRPYVEIPKRTYVSVPMSIIHAGGRPAFRDEEWLGMYQLKPLPVWDSARWLSSRIYDGYSPNDGSFAHWGRGPGQMVCISFHWTKTLGIQQGGAILHDDYEADAWLRRARFDGRTEGVPPNMDRFDQIGWHCYMSPEVAAEGLVRLSFLPKHNKPLPNDDYPDLSQLEIFK
jgi:dTDP-4-amino-4,6-dideoxygalactose transaminase